MSRISLEQGSGSAGSPESGTAGTALTDDKTCLAGCSAWLCLAQSLRPWLRQEWKALKQFPLSGIKTHVLTAGLTARYAERLIVARLEL